MKAMRFVRKNWIPLLILIILLLLVRNYYNVERFQATTVRNSTQPVPRTPQQGGSCTQSTCKAPNSWINGICYKSCGSIGPFFQLNPNDNKKCGRKSRVLGGPQTEVQARPIQTSC